MSPVRRFLSPRVGECHGCWAVTTHRATPSSHHGAPSRCFPQFRERRPSAHSSMSLLFRGLVRVCVVPGTRRVACRSTAAASLVPYAPPCTACCVLPRRTVGHTLPTPAPSIGVTCVLPAPAPDQTDLGPFLSCRCCRLLNFSDNWATATHRALLLLSRLELPFPSRHTAYSPRQTHDIFNKRPHHHVLRPPRHGGRRARPPGEA